VAAITPICFLNLATTYANIHRFLEHATNALAPKGAFNFIEKKKIVPSPFTVSK
jgi:hypothetical protein